VDSAPEWPPHVPPHLTRDTGTQGRLGLQTQLLVCTPSTGWAETGGVRRATTASSPLSSRLWTSRSEAGLCRSDLVVSDVPEGPSSMGSFDTAEAMSTTAPRRCFDSWGGLNQLRRCLERTGCTEVEGGLTAATFQPDVAALWPLGSRRCGHFCFLDSCCLFDDALFWRYLLGGYCFWRYLWRYLLGSFPCHDSSEWGRRHCGIKSITPAVFWCVDRCWPNRYSKRAAGSLDPAA